ncbi:MAG TPA: NADH:ubiquinone reductase (Na(+)-transporting) subunit C [Bacteroidia bacterium]
MSNKNSTVYILSYTVAITMFCGIALYVVSNVLKPYQDANVELDQKKRILATFVKLDDTWDKKKIEQVYSDRVKGFVINYKGELQKDKQVKDIDIEKEHKLAPEKRLYKVFEVSDEKNKNKIQYYVFAGSGKGLWDKISTYFALKSDLNTFEGVVFDHKAETPGLGARIKDDEAVYSRYAGKTIFEGDKLEPVIMMKGEGNDYSGNSHAVDGMSGATKTAIGVNEMMVEYLKAYENFIKSKKNK